MKFNSAKLGDLIRNTGDEVGNMIRGIQPGEKILISQGYGVNDDGVPLRLPAYAVPCIRLFGLLPEETELEFYVATEGSIRANGDINEEETRNCGVAMKNWLGKWIMRNYLELVHPAKGRVKITSDSTLTAIQKETVDFLEKEAGAKVMADLTLKRFLEKRGGRSALRYALEHVLYMRDPIKGIPRESFIIPPPREGHLLMVGGPQEKVFWKVRQIVRQKLGIHKEWNTHQVFTPIGSPPTYFLQPGEPLCPSISRDYSRSSLEELANNILKHVDNSFGFQKTIIRDLCLVFSGFASLEAIDSFVKSGFNLAYASDDKRRDCQLS